jgi:hypothetical protein
MDQVHQEWRRMTDAPLVTCPHCDSVVPAGDFCGHCGAHLAVGSARRTHSFAAVPSERVAHLSIISTLFPHLPHRRGAPFRVALLAGAGLVVILGAFHVFGIATVAALLILPVLYLMYLYEVEVYETEPWLVIGATMAVGALLGFALSRSLSTALAGVDLTGDRQAAFILAGIVIPVSAQAAMLVGPLLLYFFRGRFREPLDGLAFGAASGLGFTLANQLVVLWASIEIPLVQAGSPFDWALLLTRGGLLVALINASTTAVVAAAIWMHRYDRRRINRPLQSSIPVALAVAFGVQVAMGIIGFSVQDLIVDVAILAILTAALLLYVRRVIHDALLVEGAEHQIGPDAPCPECHRIVPTMAFCPACGAARVASSKHARAQIARQA